MLFNECPRRLLLYRLCFLSTFVAKSIKSPGSHRTFAAKYGGVGSVGVWTQAARVFDRAIRVLRGTHAPNQSTPHQFLIIMLIT